MCQTRTQALYKLTFEQQEIPTSILEILYGISRHCPLIRRLHIREHVRAIRAGGPATQIPTRINWTKSLALMPNLEALDIGQSTRLPNFPDSPHSLPPSIRSLRIFAWPLQPSILEMVVISSLPSLERLQIEADGPNYPTCPALVRQIIEVHGHKLKSFYGFGNVWYWIKALELGSYFGPDLKELIVGFDFFLGDLEIQSPVETVVFSYTSSRPRRSISAANPSLGFWLMRPTLERLRSSLKRIVIADVEHIGEPLTLHDVIRSRPEPVSMLNEIEESFGSYLRQGIEFVDFYGQPVVQLESVSLTL